MSSLRQGALCLLVLGPFSLLGETQGAGGSRGRPPPGPGKCGQYSRERGSSRPPRSSRSPARALTPSQLDPVTGPMTSTCPCSFVFRLGIFIIMSSPGPLWLLRHTRVCSQVPISCRQISPGGVHVRCGTRGWPVKGRMPDAHQAHHPFLLVTQEDTRSPFHQACAPEGRRGFGGPSCRRDVGAAAGCSGLS